MQTLILLLTLLGPPKIPYKAIIPRVKVITFEATAYTAHDAGMNGKGVTASGKKATPWRTVAVSRNIPFNSKIYVPKLNKTFTVEDRGSKKWIDKRNGMDIFVRTKSEAYKIGRRKMKGVVIE